MDTIAQLGVNLRQVQGPTFATYGELLEKSKNVSAIRSTCRETFSFGPHKKQKLDLYKPSTSVPLPLEGKKLRPVIVFIHGGGLVGGGRIISEIPGGLAYANIGYFFAENYGFEVVVTTYRLLGDGAKYPSGGDDVNEALTWVQENYARGGSDSEVRDIYILGNSAGAVHLSTWLFGEQYHVLREGIFRGAKSVKLLAIVLLGCPFRWDLSGPLKNLLTVYYNDVDTLKKAEATAVMDSATRDLSKEQMAKMPRLLVAVSELEPKAIMHVTADDFLKLWTERGGRGEYMVLDGHNHFSPPLALGNGIAREELWGNQVAEWLIKPGNRRL